MYNPFLQGGHKALWAILAAKLSVNIFMGNHCGNNLRHFNVDALSYIVVSTKTDIKRIISIYETKAKDIENFPSTPDMKLSKDVFVEILNIADIHQSGMIRYFTMSILLMCLLDQDLFVKYFTMLDVSGFDEVSLMVSAQIIYYQGFITYNVC